MKPRSVRTRLLAIVLVTLAVALAAATYGFNVLLADSTSRDANALLGSRADSELALLDLSGGRLRAIETSDDTLADSEVWVFQGTQLVERPRARTAADAVAASLAGGPTRYVDVDKQDLRLLAKPVVIGGRRVGTLVTGLSLAPYEQTRRHALIGSLAFAGVLLALVAVALYLLLRLALRPVARMTAQAAAWSEQELDHRFEPGEPYDELTTLAATLDQLLDRIAASLRHERRFSAELSHELRTPLANVIAEAELALRRDRTPEAYREALTSILGNAQAVARTVEALVLAAQQEAGHPGTADAFAAVRDVTSACTEVARQRGVKVVVETPPAPVRVGVDRDLLERILQPVVENACRYGRRSVSITLARRSPRVHLRVEDDGPGVDAAERETIFEPGSRGSAGRSEGAGAGLGLALARRLARAASGDVHAEPSATGGCFVITLPTA